MKKLASLLFYCIPFIALSSNPPPPGLPDEPVVVPIDSLVLIVLAAGILFGCYIIFKAERAAK